MENKDLNNFSKNQDDKTFILLIKLLRMFGVICKFLWWIPLCWSIVSFFKLEFSQGIFPLLVVSCDVDYLEGHGKIKEGIRDERVNHIQARLGF